MAQRIHHQTLKKVILEASRDAGISYDIGNMLFRSIFECIKEKMKEVDVTSISKEEFDSMKTSFNLPGIGKFYLYWNKIIKDRESINERIKSKKS
jgi:hypothetical protein